MTNPQLLLTSYLKTLRLPTFLREYPAVARSVERLPTFVAPPFVGAARPHTPRLPPLPWGLTPTGSRHDLGITYAYGRITMATKRSERSQRRLDNPLKNGILRNQVA